jgi:2-polyprenyl-3-methyl-5-hydroxy-6-metoxy-1,4-benzoquinol methylase
MKRVDRILQQWRIQKAAEFIYPGDRVLDIGCADGALFHLVPDLGESVGIEPGLDCASLPTIPNVTFYSGYFPDALPGMMSFDIITMLAVLEHVPVGQQDSLASACASHLRPGGRLVITVPSPAVDSVLTLLKWLQVIDGMSIEQHYGFESAQTPEIFSPYGLDLITRRRFQLGFNNLFVFVRRSGDRKPLCTVR